MEKLSGRNVVVMGATSGIGLAAAQQLAGLGASVVVTGRNPEKAEQVRQDNSALTVEVLDAASLDALERFYRRLERFDDLVLCISGAKGAGSFSSVNIAELREEFAEKFFASFRRPSLHFRSCGKTDR
jgi:NAD(P)-dependent dehydrogenase (short-subunit alcohol dehydrogenase family)